MFNLPTILTAANLMSGILAILLAVSGRLDLAPFAIFAGAVFDFLDGFVARMLKATGELGKQLDSLADMVTFGVAPGIIMMALMVEISLNPFPDFSQPWFWDMGEYNSSFKGWFNSILSREMPFRPTSYYPFIALLIPFFSIFRLAKFNLDKRQTESFIGLPTPANTLFFMSFPLVYAYAYPTTSAQVELYSVLFHPLLMSGLIIVLSLMLISEMPLFSLKFKSMKWKENEIRFIFLLISLIFIIIL